MDSRREIEKRLTAFILLILALLAAGGFIGCALTGAESTPVQQMAVTPSAVRFGGVRVGQFGSKGATVTNQGSTTLTISQAALTGSSFFILSPPHLPLVLAPGKSTLFGIEFLPQAEQPANATLTIVSASGAQVTIPVTGLGGESLISVNPPSMNFGSVAVGATSTQTLMITNLGNATMNITSEAISGAGFNLPGPHQFLGISNGQTVPLTVQFAPQAGGSVSGTLTLVSDAPTSPLRISLSANGVSAADPQLTINPTSINFNNVTVGSSSQQPVSLSNTGNVNVTITQAAPSGSGFSISGISVPLTLVPGQNASFSAQFAPANPGIVTGSIIITSNASGSPATIALSGAGVVVSTPQLSIIPNPVNFNSVVTGTTSSQTVRLTNTGSGNLTVNTANISGAGFSMSGLNPPLILPTGQAATFTVQFAPQSPGSASGSLAFSSNDPNSPTTVQLSGAGVAPTFVLTPNPSSVSFGNVNVGSSSSQNVTLTNSGNSNINISQVNVTGASFSATGVAPPVTLTPGQVATLSAKFSPSGTGNTSGNIQVASNASSPTNIPLSGNGVQPVSHSATLNWIASTTLTVVGYNAYRGGQSGGPYSKLNSSPVAATTFVDATVQSGQTYFWVVTAVDSNGTESVFSNEVSATVPTP